MQVFAATNGFLDRITRRARARVPRRPDRSACTPSTPTCWRRSASGDWSDETQEAAAQRPSREFADDFGYDLDEEGQPLDEREVGETTREQEGIRSSGGDGDGDEGDEEAAAEQEEAAAPA